VYVLRGLHDRDAACLSELRWGVGAPAAWEGGGRVGREDWGARELGRLMFGVEDLLDKGGEKPGFEFAVAT